MTMLRFGHRQGLDLGSLPEQILLLKQIADQIFGSPVSDGAS
jgi:hypothetical protein